VSVTSWNQYLCSRRSSKKSGCNPYWQNWSYSSIQAISGKWIEGFDYQFSYLISNSVSACYVGQRLIGRQQLMVSTRLRSLKAALLCLWGCYADFAGDFSGDRVSPKRSFFFFFFSIMMVSEKIPSMGVLPLVDTS